MGVQIPFSFLKSLDFKPLQTKVQILPWQMNNIFIISFFPFKKSEFTWFWGVSTIILHIPLQRETNSA